MTREKAEATLRELGAEKCIICGYFMDKKYLNRERICNECENPIKEDCKGDILWTE